jgi:hypothetical protein
MAYGQIRHLDIARRTAVIALESGGEVTVTFPPGANIEVVEPTSLGTMGGTLEDLRVGYWVDASIPEAGAGPCSCVSLTCLS